MLGFTGIDSVYEAPVNPDLVLKAGEQTLNECVSSVVSLLREEVCKLYRRGHFSLILLTVRV